ncbi:uncharacterized protein [Oryctolagus cuniculus]|uniref:uncharacterized protein n=1 Tax=Oryctolagus cuniculus TaxID=9986 RepID=UPI00387A0C2E
MDLGLRGEGGQRERNSVSRPLWLWLLLHGACFGSPCSEQVLYGSATVVEMMSAVYSALSSSSSPSRSPSLLPPPALPRARSRSLARSLAPVCKCVIEAKYGAVGGRRRSSRIRLHGGGRGHPLAGGPASRAEHGERTAAAAARALNPSVRVAARGRSPRGAPRRAGPRGAGGKKRASVGVGRSGVVVEPLLPGRAISSGHRTPRWR